MRLTTFLLLTTLARVPSVVSSAVTGTLTHNGNYTAAFITYGVTLVITVICVLWYRRISKQEKLENQEEKDAPEKEAGEQKPGKKKNRKTWKNKRKKK
jgi:dipeptide/tripeptide permease